MERKDLPLWLRAIDAMYAASLYLLPSDFRREYGPEMRRVLRDHCQALATAPLGQRVRAMFDVVGDLGRGLGHEHAIAWRERGATRPLFLGVCLFVAGACWFAREPVQLAIEDYANAAPARAAEQAMAFYLRHERDAAARSDAREDAGSRLIAALLYLDVASEAPRRFMRPGPQAPADAAQLRAKAERSFEHAWRAGELDTGMLWLMATRCDPASTCDPGRALRDLAARSPDNAAVMRLELASALNAGDQPRARRALASMARATRVSSFPGQRFALFADRLDEVGDRDFIQRMMPWSGMDATARPRSFARSLAVNYSQGFSAGLALNAAAAYCQPSVPDAASRRADCLAMARLFAEYGSRFSERSMGYATLCQWLCGTPEEGDLLTRFRYFDWLYGARDAIFVDRALDDATVERLTGVWEQTLRDTDDEIAAAEAIVRAAGRPLEVPSAYVAYDLTR